MTHFLLSVTLTLTLFIIGIYADIALTPFPAASQSNEQFSGSITLTSSSTARITGLTFAGVAPDTYIVVYNGTLSGQTASQAVKIYLGISTTTCNSKLGTYTAPGVDASLELPIGYTWSQFEKIGAWCFTANALFATTSIPASSSSLPTTVASTRICPATLPLPAFPVASQSNEQFSGSITLTSSTTARITGLTFAGVAPDTFIVAYSGTLSAATSSQAVKLLLGVTTTTCNSKLGTYTAPGVDASLELPVGYTWGQFEKIGAWCFTANALFATTTIPTTSSALPTALPTSRICPATVSLVAFSPASQSNEQTSGMIVLTSTTTARVLGLTFAGVAPSTRFVAYTGILNATTASSAVKLSLWFPDTDITQRRSSCESKLGVLNAPGKEARLELQSGYTWNQFTKIGVWCFTANALFASTSIPVQASDLPIAPIGSTICPASIPLTPFPAASQSNEQFSGAITLISSNQARVTGLTFAGVAPSTYIVAYNGTLTSQTATQAVKLNLILDTTSTSTCQQKLGVLNAPGKDGYLELPAGYTWSQFSSIGAWCFTANALFGSTTIPSSPAIISLPRAVTGSILCPLAKPSVLIGNLGPANALAHGTQGTVYATSTTTLRIEGFSFDGTAPDTHFMAGRLPTGITTISSQYAMKVVATDNCIQSPLTTYNNAVIELELPMGMTVADIGFLAVWCYQARALFGAVTISDAIATEINTKLGVSYATPTCTGVVAGQYENCEPLDSEYQVSWTVERSTGMIAFQLQAITPQQVRAAAMNGVITPFWMGFGISGSQTGTQMIGSDVTIASYNIQDDHVSAVDFSPQFKQQCSVNGGVCSDVHAGGINDVSSVSGTYDSTAPQGLGMGVTTVRYRRPIIPSDIILKNNATADVTKPLDQSFDLMNPQYVIWAVGPLNIDQNPLYHYRHIPNGAGTTPLHLHFGRSPTNNCPAIGSTTPTSTPTGTTTTAPTKDCSPRGAWIRPYISNTTTIVARIGPVGGQAKGYAPITGQPSWGISWYLNDILVPVLAVERGKTYTFIVHGGTEPTNSAGYHPFYITNSSFGGLAQASASDAPEKVYAGGLTSAPIGTGSACDIQETTLSTTSYTVATFQQYKQTLNFSNTCDNTSQDIMSKALKWTVPMDAPDKLFYQCLLHRNLGWRIRVYDAGAVNLAELAALSTPAGSALPAACSVTTTQTGGTTGSSSSSSSSSGTMMTTPPNHATLTTISEWVAAVVCMVAYILA